MYIIVVDRPDSEYKHYFGPFQTEQRAVDYGLAMPEDWGWHVMPITVPNCIGVTFTTKY